MNRVPWRQVACELPTRSKPLKGQETVITASDSTGNVESVVVYSQALGRLVHCPVGTMNNE